MDVPLDGKRFVARWGVAERRCWNDKRPRNGEISVGCSAALIQKEPWGIELNEQVVAGNCTVMLQNSHVSYSYNGTEKIVVAYQGVHYEGACETNQYSTQGGTCSYVGSMPIGLQPAYENFSDGRCDSAEKSKTSFSPEPLPLYSKTYLFIENKRANQDKARRECEQAGNLWSDVSQFRPVRDPEYCYQKYEDGFVVTVSYDKDHRQSFVCENPINFFY
ncbi:MAG TPA: hypothetical protein VFO10_17170 [Oligoflexus sp.]|uniref:hypothetical protein n=1 Tax=Oligoflexus sp. TaxID=1971216 RepID=UPI002D80D671|nr:hypothetical protein [Oligoflexus sp.]HET9238992.1 hypothetical protein [Oligoflexus sp.]